jgi:sugar O-acyltransferase (sialic acid O-acetyltransferase NeuD family)
MSGGWVVLGAGGHARSVVDVLERCGEHVVAVSGDAGESPWHITVLADDTAAIDLLTEHNLRACVAIGAAGPRARLVADLLARGVSLPPVTARTATVAPGAHVGAGTVVLEHAHVGPGADLGAGVIVNTAAVVEHDCVVGDGSHVAPGAVLLGGARIGSMTLVGSGARVLPGITVGSRVTVGAGAVVTTSVPDGVTVTGMPAATRGATA